MTTMVIISIVKSSLALSLGLVGALSIVRFRAAIKEPEELVRSQNLEQLSRQIGGRKVLWAAGELDITDQVIQKLDNAWDNTTRK